MKKTEKLNLYSFKSRMESDNSISRTGVSVTESGNVFIKRTCLNQNDLTTEGWDLIRKTKFGNYYSQSYCFKSASFKAIVHILHSKFDFFGFQQSEGIIKDDVDINLIDINEWAEKNLED